MDPQISKRSKSGEVLSGRLLDLLNKVSSAKEIVSEIKRNFSEMEISINKAFDKLPNPTKDFDERIRKIEAFVRLSALEYISLHEDIVKFLKLADLEENEKEEVIRISQKMIALYKGRSLLALFANRNNKKRKGIFLLIENKENMMIKRSLARYFLHCSGNLDEIEPYLNKYGERAFGLKENYESFRCRAIGIADAYCHMESMGDKVFFPSPKMEDGH